MSLANQQGGHIVSMRITRNSSNESTTTLKKPFLKDASKWSCQMTDCFVNRSSPILGELLDGQTAHFTIVPHLLNPPTFVPDNLEFRPYKCRSVLDYYEQLNTFCSKFSYIYSRGKQIIEALPAFAGLYNLPFTTPINYLEHDFLGGGILAADVGYSSFDEKPLRAALTGGLKLEFLASIEFCEFFYITVHPRIQTLLGFAPNLFSVNIANFLGLVIVYDDLTQPLPAPALNILPPLQAARFPSVSSIKQLDERSSLDLWVSFPISNRIEVLNGIESHEHLLGRFDLTDVQEFVGTTFRVGGKRKLAEKFQSGMENLTRNNPDYEANHLLPGQIQFVNIRIRTRYFDRITKQFTNYDSDFEDAMWHLRLLFCKKT